MKKVSIGIIAALSVAAISLCQAQPMGQTTVITTTEPMTKVTLKIKEPRSLMRHQKEMNMPSVITLGEKTFKLPPGVDQVTVMHNLGNVGMVGRPLSLRVAYNNSTCSKIEIMGRPMQEPSRMLTIYVGEERMPNGQVRGYCEKAVLSGSR